MPLSNKTLPLAAGQEGPSGPEHEHSNGLSKHEPDTAPAQAGGQAMSRSSFPGLVLEATAFTRQQLLHPALPQVALAGRSNVGKSSLINALAGRKALAKVSATPGKTRSINYYRVQGKEGYVADLPGYGYARCSQAERNKWAELLQYYLTKTPGLKALIVLLDARLPPQNADKELLAFAAGMALPFTAVLTKADKCSKKELHTTLRAWEALAGKDALLVSSSKNLQGIEQLGQRILEILGI